MDDYVVLLGLGEVLDRLLDVDVQQPEPQRLFHLEFGQGLLDPELQVQFLQRDFIGERLPSGIINDVLELLFHSFDLGLAAGGLGPDVGLKRLDLGLGGSAFVEAV